MASSINASTSSGVVTTADNSGILNLQSNGTTVATINSSGFNLPSANTINAANTFGFKNRLINGNMVIDQRNAGASVTPADLTYTLDRWYARQTTSGKFSVQQNAGAVTPPAGFTNYLGCTSLSAYSVGSTDLFAIEQRIEGFNSADLSWGTANAKTITLSFWVRSSLTGNFGGNLRNGGSDYNYAFSYSIPVANTWTQISVTISGPTAGTWAGATNGIGVIVELALGVGASYVGTGGVWTSSPVFAPTGSVSVVGTSGATWYVTGVQFEVGSQATSFDFRSIGTELALCQRYFEVYVSGGNNTGIMAMSTGSTTSGRGTYIQKVQKRANPSSVTFLAANQYLYQGAGINAAPSAISVAVSSPSAVLVDVTISGATAFQTANLLENSAAGTNSISISAEL